MRFVITDEQIKEIKDLAWKLEDMAANDIAPLKEDDFKVLARINEIFDNLDRLIIGGKTIPWKREWSN
jgi:hypothetical protein